MIKKKNIINIRDKDGLHYAKISGDFNSIHLKNLEGYNSIYGEKICHGCFVVEEFLKNIFKNNFKLNEEYNLSVRFEKYFKYNSEIDIVRLKNNKYSLKQNNITKSKIKINNHLDNENLINNYFLKKYKFYKIKKISKHKKDLKLLLNLIQIISHHVGMIYPGKNSIIENLEITYLKKLLNIKPGLYSKKIKKNYPFVENYLYYQKYLIQFGSIFRPSLKIKTQKPNLRLLNLIKKNNKNILIIGASNGLGHQTLNLLKVNYKIKIIATYFKNLIIFKNKNIVVKKIDIFKDINKIIEIINNYKIGKVFYFPTTKIVLDSTNSKTNEYKKIYVNLPLEILKKIKKNKIKFFYPSTIFINNNNKNSKYSKIKLDAEKKLSQYSKKKRNINLLIPRLPQINTKQNLNVLGYKFPSLVEVLNGDKSLQDSFFK